MLDSESRYADLDREQARVPWLERRMARRIYDNFYEQGIAVYPSWPQLAHERALFFSWRSSILFWASLQVVPGAVLFVALQWTHGSYQHGLFLAVAVLFVACNVVAHLRLMQARRMHPD